MARDNGTLRSPGKNLEVPGSEQGQSDRCRWLRAKDALHPGRFRREPDQSPALVQHAMAHRTGKQPRQGGSDCLPRRLHPKFADSIGRSCSAEGSRLQPVGRVSPTPPTLKNGDTAPRLAEPAERASTTPLLQRRRTGRAAPCSHGAMSPCWKKSPRAERGQTIGRTATQRRCYRREGQRRACWHRAAPSSLSFTLRVPRGLTFQQSSQ